MTFMVKPIVQPVMFVPPADVALYTAAGWIAATAVQISAWAAADPYNGTQGAPHISSLAPKAAGIAPVPPTYRPDGH